MTQPISVFATIMKDNRTEIALQIIGAGIVQTPGEYSSQVYFPEGTTEARVPCRDHSMYMARYTFTDEILLGTYIFQYLEYPGHPGTLELALCDVCARNASVHRAVAFCRVRKCGKALCAEHNNEEFCEPCDDAIDEEMCSRMHASDFHI